MWFVLCACAVPPVPAPVPEPAPVPAPVPAPEPEPHVTAGQTERVLFPDGLPADLSCDRQADDYVRCLVVLRYQGHPEQASALALYDELGDLAGLEREQDFDGGFRGIIHLVPALPVGPYRQHLDWVLSAQRQIGTFIAEIEQQATEPVHYRHRALAWRFTRSVGRATPSAYALDWEVGYNVSGSLLRSEESVRDTIFHELFHLNDQAHGQWSRRVLGALVDGIDARCEHQTPCLTRYSPTPLKVKGGTFYAFQHDNGDMANEYAAELAQRYFQEQREAAAGKVHAGGWFACRAPENAQAMRELAEEFFGGVDLTGGCR
jgi:hypothetical protein